MAKKKPEKIEKGKEASPKKPSKQTPAWVEYKPAEVEEIIVNLANSGMTPSEIGMSLRDQYGIPSIKNLTGFRVEQILEKHSLQTDIPREMLNLIRKSVTLYKHLGVNKKDGTAKKGYILTVSKIRRLTKYYIEKGRLPKAWKYTPETAALLVK